VKIRKLECMFFFHEFERPLGNSTDFFRGKHANVLKITTDEGISGFGEFFGVWESYYEQLKDFLPCMVGVSLASWEHVERALRSFLDGILPPCERRSIESAFNLAYWDIRGKASQKSVLELWGGTAAPRQVPVYGTGCFYRVVDRCEDQLSFFYEELQEYVNRGYRGLKMKAGRYSVDEELSLVRAVRKELPESVELMVDINCGTWNAEQTARYAEQVEELGISWLEEPFHPHEYDRYRELAEKTALPLAAGEHETEMAGFERVVRSGVKIVQPELSLCGGFAAAGPLIELAGRHSIGITPHVWGMGFLYAAALQFYSLCGGDLLFEYPFLDDPLRDELFDGLKLKNGCLTVPAGPGWGVEWDETVLRKYLVFLLSS